MASQTENTTFTLSESSHEGAHIIARPFVGIVKDLPCSLHGRTSVYPRLGTCTGATGAMCLASIDLNVRFVGELRYEHF
jgi:hypothetical protein